MFKFPHSDVSDLYTHRNINYMSNTAKKNLSGKLRKVHTKKTFR